MKTVVHVSMVWGLTIVGTALTYIVYNYRFLIKVSTFILQAIERLGGQQMKLECDYIKSKPLDQTKQEILMNINHSHSEKWEIKESFACLKQSPTEMKIYHESLQENHAIVTKEKEEMKNSQKNTIPSDIRGKLLKMTWCTCTSSLIY